MMIEFCDGSNLETLLTKKVLKMEQKVDIMKQIINGCHYLYQKNIFHRDIKPENILMHANKAKITDFGFA